MPSWQLYQPGQWSRGLWWTSSLVRIFFLSYVILNNSRVDSGLKKILLFKGCVFHWSQAVWRKNKELGLAVTYMRREATHRYLKQLMALPFLPAQDIPATFQQLRDRVLTDSLQSLVVYLERQWIQHQMFRPAFWTVYRQTVRTNNDVEGIYI